MRDPGIRTPAYITPPPPPAALPDDHASLETDQGVQHLKKRQLLRSSTIVLYSMRVRGFVDVTEDVLEDKSLVLPLLLLLLLFFSRLPLAMEAQIRLREPRSKCLAGGWIGYVGLSDVRWVTGLH